MNFFAKLALNVFGPMIINRILEEINPEKIKELLAEGADELHQLADKGFDRLAEKVKESDNTLDDKALELARNVFVDGVAALLASGAILDVLEMGAQALVALAEKTDNDIDDTLANAVLDAIRAAKD